VNYSDYTLIVSEIVSLIYMSLNKQMTTFSGEDIQQLVTQFQTFYYIYILEIPTNKGANSYKLKISKILNLLHA